MLNQLRYLLHGNREKYEDITTPLYKTSEQSTLWQKLGQQVLQEKGEAWRLIDSSLVEHIPSAKQQTLGIKLLKPEEVIELIDELGADCVDAIPLEESQRYELLNKIEYLENEELWKALKLHKTSSGELVNIQAGKTYLENQTFHLDEKLAQHIVIIQKNNKLKQDYIDLWTPEALINTVLNLQSPQNPHEYCDLILDALQNLSALDKSRLQNTRWLVDKDKNGIRPQDILRLPENLQTHLSTIVELSKGEYTEFSFLPEYMQKHQNIRNLKKLFSRWDENDVIEFILEQYEPHLNFDIIIDALDSLFSDSQKQLSEINYNNLNKQAWLADVHGNKVSSTNILHYPSIKDEIEELLRQVSSPYIASSQLNQQIRNHKCWQWLHKELFLTNDRALSVVGSLLKEADDYQLGEFEIDKFPLDELSQVFEKIDVSLLPAWSFAQKLSSEDFKQYLLPNLLGKLNEDKLINILKRISSINEKPERITINVFNYYLSLAVNDYDFVDIIGKINLLSRRETWVNPNRLTWGNRENIDAAYLLNSDQESVLSGYLNNIHTNNLQNSLEFSETAVDETNFDVLKSYFQTWQQHCPSEPIGAFLTLLYGDEGSVRNLAHFYLGKRNLGKLRQRLLNNTPKRTFHICVGKADNRTRKVQSIMGESFEASLINTNNPPHLFVSRLAIDTTVLELLPIQPQNFQSSELINILKESTKKLLQEVYERNTSSIDSIWQDLIESDQLDIQVAKNFLLEGAPYVMRMLGVHEFIPSVHKILNRWDEFCSEKAEMKQQNRPIQNIEKRIDNLVFQLSNLLEEKSPDSENVKEQLLRAVRKKIDSFGYQYQSIPFELFQNADDAVVEWQIMSQKQNFDNCRGKFIIKYDSNKIQFIHAGRPIGCFQHPDYPEIQHKDKGFHRDLQKMLAFNISDKGEKVTGKFGLGFKSIYLACKKPYVLSKNLGFTVEGGLIPSRLPTQKVNELREECNRYIDLSDATIIEVNLENEVSRENVLTHFQSVANILLVFSRAIKNCQFIDSDNHIIHLCWNPSSVMNIPGVEIGKYKNISDVQESLLFCLKTDADTKASLVIGMTEKDGQIKNTLPQDTSTFWVTAPTLEKLFIGFAINADFDVTTGRESLVKSSLRNRELAQKIGKNLGKILHNLFEASQDNWQAFTNVLGFRNIDEYEFWDFLWKELAVSWQKQEHSEGIDIIENMLASNNHAMGYLITACPALPSGLYGVYRQLISLNKIKYKVTGKLSEEKTFLQVATWTRFQQQCKSNFIVDKKWDEVNKLLGSDFVRQRYTVNDLRLLDVLKNEIGNNEPRATSAQAMYMGELITPAFLNSPNREYELRQLQIFLEKINFLSKTGNYLPCQQLLVSDSNIIEEKRLVNFAYDSRILHPDYEDSALEFFYACRLRRDTIPPEEIAKWALQAKSNEQRKAVHVYLLEGEKREEIAPLLYSNRENSWFTNDKSILDILEYMVLIKIEKEKLIGESNSLEASPVDFEEIESNNPLLEIHTNCTRNDFSLARSPHEIEEFTSILLTGLDSQYSQWKGYVYHFTHVENAVSILQEEKLKSRNSCHQFSDSAGANLIANTREDVKKFARFYFRPKTPTQWHNEGLGKRKGNIYALCPVPIFFRFNLERILKTHGNKCAVSNGNLAANSFYYGNSKTFVEQFFDFGNVYSTLHNVGKEAFLRASQQEFIVHNYLNFSELNLEDISIICRTHEDKETLLNLIGRESKYASRIFKEREIVEDGSLFNHDNPYISVDDKVKFIDIQIDKYDEYNINGNLILKLTEQQPFDSEIMSPYGDISRIKLGELVNVNSSRHLQLKCKINTCINVSFEENGKEWLVYTNELRYH